MTEFSRSASAIANPDLPVAVGPPITISPDTPVLFFARLGTEAGIDQFFGEPLSKTIPEIHLQAVVSLLC
jgi:hypothetical protein